MSFEVAQNDFSRKMKDFDTLTYKNCQKMWAIWAKLLLPQALKSCPKCNKFGHTVDDERLKPNEKNYKN